MVSVEGYLYKTSVLYAHATSLACCLMAAAVSAQDAALPAARATAGFGCDLYRELAPEAGNLFFSPYSISVALAMTREGARGETARQMEKVLHLPSGSPGEIEKQLAAALQPRLVWDGIRDDRRQVAAYELSVANAVWGQDGIDFLVPFRERLDDDYDAPLRLIDFGDSQKAREIINGWVSAETRGRIEDILQPPLPLPLTRLALANAIFFKASWRTPFEKARTGDAPFTTAAGQRVETPTMRVAGPFGYGEAGGARLLELPYRGGDLSMLIALPADEDGLGALEGELDRERLGTWSKALEVQRVAVSLPRFEFTMAADLAKILERMGMPDAFDGSRADFSGMTRGRDLFISNVVHKGFVAVDEAGTEAAAATVVLLKERSAPAERPIEFRADHPFLFAILHRASGCVLFLGRVADPTAD